MREEDIMTIESWENTPQLSDLKGDYESAQSDHDIHVGNVLRWRNNRDGKQTIKTKKGRSKVVPKLIRKQAEWR